MSPAQLGAERVRIRAGDVDPQPTPGLSIFGRFELCEQPDSPYPLGLTGRRLLIEEATKFASSETSETSDASGISDTSDALEGVFDRLRSFRGVVPDPDQRESSGVLVVLVNNLDRAREADFNRWYDEVHVPDILSAGSFHRATRYYKSDATDPTAPTCLAAYLAVYETDWKDPLAAQRALAARPNPAGLWDSIAPVHLAVYRRR